jgi:hypothetical protein
MASDVAKTCDASPERFNLAVAKLRALNSGEQALLRRRRVTEGYDRRHVLEQ